MTVGIPPGNGPQLVDGNWLNALAAALNYTYLSGVTANVAASQTGGTIVPSGANLVQIDASVTNGSLVLPAAVAGTEITIANNTNNALNVYASPKRNILTGSLDTINALANASPFTGITVLPGTMPTVTFYCARNGLWLTTGLGGSGGGGGGTVTSVAMSVPSGLSIVGSPITSSGTFAVSWSGSPIPASAIPAPTLTTLGGVQAINAVAHQWIASINTSGVPQLTQPAFTDITGSVAAGQMPGLTGDVVSTAGTVSTTISLGAVTLAKMANLSANSVIGNNTGSAATPIALTQAQLTAMVNTFTGALSGAVPSSGGGTSNFLRADGTWTTPAGAGTVTSVGLAAPTGLAVSGSPVTSSGTLTLSWSGTIPSAQIPNFTSTVNGGVPASGGGSTNFLRADGTWAAPPGGGGGGASAFVYENAGFGASSLTGYMVDSSGGAISVTMPAGPSVGAWVELMDAAGAWATHNVTINGNGSNINSSSSMMTLNVANTMVRLFYVNSTIGWKVLAL